MAASRSSDDVLRRMREDWNERAREDAHYYVAFGRRDQDSEEFFSTGHEQVEGLRREMRRLQPSSPRARRALEIGCGPGRLMRPLSAHFGEIHGVDISDEMVARARENLRGVAHAHVHVAESSDLAAFADDSFDFVYSYAVFQHIPSRDVVFHYMTEARRVLKPGGILRCQLNGLPEDSKRCDTWSGARIQAAEIDAFAWEQDMQLLALEGVDTQYMWATMRKQPRGWRLRPREIVPGSANVRRITNAHSSEPVAPVSGRFAALALWVENLTEDADIEFLSVRAGGKQAFISYLGHPDPDSLQQLNIHLPSGLPTGLVQVEIRWGEIILSAPAYARIIPAPPLVPRVVSVTDGIDLMSGVHMTSGAVKVTIDEVEDPSAFQATVTGVPISGYEIFCIDPRIPRYEVNFHLPTNLPSGSHRFEFFAGSRRLGEVSFTTA